MSSREPLTTQLSQPCRWGRTTGTCSALRVQRSQSRAIHQSSLCIHACWSYETFVKPGCACPSCLPFQPAHVYSDAAILSIKLVFTSPKPRLCYHLNRCFQVAALLMYSCHHPHSRTLHSQNGDGQLTANCCVTQEGPTANHMIQAVCRKLLMFLTRCKSRPRGRQPPGDAHGSADPRAWSLDRDSARTR